MLCHYVNGGFISTATVLLIPLRKCFTSLVEQLKIYCQWLILKLLLPLGLVKSHEILFLSHATTDLTNQNALNSKIV